MIQFILMPFIDHKNALSTFFANTLYLVAAGYWTIITFYGYNVLHFLHHTELLLTPMAGWIITWLICTVLKINLTGWGMHLLFLGVQLRKS